VVGQFVAMLQTVGYESPRLKILPPLQIGAEAERSHGYRESERVSRRMMKGFDASELVCEHSRIVTDRGVYVCPILIESPDALLGETLADAARPYAITHGACFTCYQYGSICSNASSAVRGDK